MAPLSEAIRTTLAWVRHDETHVYEGNIDSQWCIGSVPHGGYIASILVGTGMDFQQLSHHTYLHPDPTHVSLQYFASAALGPFQVHCKLALPQSKRWTRLDISLYQTDPKNPGGRKIECVRAHALFSVLPSLGAPAEPSPDNCTVMPHSLTPFARICPIVVHPSECKETPMFAGFEANKHVRWSEGRTMCEPEGDRPKLDWGAWVELKGPEENVTKLAALIPFFSDLFRNGPECLPKGQSPGSSWFPTLTLALEFKSRFPLEDASRSGCPAQNTVGLYSVSKFISHGRHDETVEVWSAPCAIGDVGAGVGSDEWRKNAQILAISTQMALVVPFEVNTRKAKI